MAQPSLFASVVPLTDLQPTGWSVLPSPVPPFLAAALAVGFLLYLRAARPQKRYAPFLNPRKRFEFTDTARKLDMYRKADKMLQAWFRDHPDEPVRIISDDTGGTTVLPPYMADEIRNDARLNHGTWFAAVRPRLALWPYGMVGKHS